MNNQIDVITREIVYNDKTKLKKPTVLLQFLTD